MHSGDRVWRMPVFNLYTKQMTETLLADLNNIGSASRYGGASTAAAFLKVRVNDCRNSLAEMNNKKCFAKKKSFSVVLLE